MERLSNPEVFTVVNRYIGVCGGYLGDFSYRTHAEFYLEFCDVDVDADKLEGTTRERFLTILQRSEAARSGAHTKRRLAQVSGWIG